MIGSGVWCCTDHVGRAEQNEKSRGRNDEEGEAADGLIDVGLVNAVLVEPVEVHIRLRLNFLYSWHGIL